MIKITNFTSSPTTVGSSPSAMDPTSPFIDPLGSTSPLPIQSAQAIIGSYEGEPARGLSSRVVEFLDQDKLSRVIVTIKEALSTGAHLDEIICGVEFNGLSPKELTIVLHQIALVTLISSPESLFKFFLAVTCHRSWSKLRLEDLIFLSVQYSNLAAMSTTTSPPVDCLIEIFWRHPTFLTSKGESPAFSSNIKSSMDYFIYVINFIWFIKREPETQLTLDHVLNPLLVKNLEDVDIDEILRACDDAPKLKTSFIQVLAVAHEADANKLCQISLNALQKNDFELFEACFPHDLLVFTSNRFLQEMLYSFVGDIFPLLRAAAIDSDPDNRFRQLFLRIFKKVTQRALETPAHCLKMLYLQTFSSAVEFGENPISSLDRSKNFPIYMTKYLQLEEFIRTQPMDSAEKSVVEKLKKTIEDQILVAFLSDFARFQQPENLYIMSVLQSIEKMKPHDSLVIPFIIEAFPESHVVSLFLRMNEDGAIDLFVYNTGLGLEFHHHKATPTHFLVYPYAVVGLTKENIKSILSNIETISKRSFEGSLPKTEVLRLTYETIDPGLTHSSDSVSLGMLPYKQQKIGNCTSKALSTWMHDELPETIYRSFKVFSQQMLIYQMKKIIEDYKKLRGGCCPYLSDEEVLEEIGISIVTPHKALEVLEIAERETLYTSMKEAMIGSPIEDAILFLETDPYNPKFLNKIIHHPDLFELSPDQLVMIIRGLLVTEQHHNLRILESLDTYPEAMDILRSQLEPWLQLCRHERFTDEQNLLRLFKVALQIAPYFAIRITDIVSSSYYLELGKQMEHLAKKYRCIPVLHELWNYRIDLLMDPDGIPYLDQFIDAMRSDSDFIVFRNEKNRSLEKLIVEGFSSGMLSVFRTTELGETLFFTTMKDALVYLDQRSIETLLLKIEHLFYDEEIYKNLTSPCNRIYIEQLIQLADLMRLHRAGIALRLFLDKHFKK